MGTIKVVFFDAAGTLFHVRGSVAEVYLTYASRYAVQPAPELVAAVDAAVRRAFAESPPPVFATTDPQTLKRCERLWWFDVVHHVFYRVGLFDGFDEFFDQVFTAFAGPHHWMLYPDTQDALTALKAKGYELGIISNFDSRLFSVLEGLGLRTFFDTVTISTRAGAAKPAARIFQLALEQHAVDPEEAAHVGDSPEEDLAGARAVGLQGLLLDRTGEHATAGPHVLRSLHELAPRLA